MADAKRLLLLMARRVKWLEQNKKNKALAEKDPAKLKEQFNGFDGDKDGNLTPDELKKFIKSLSSKHTDEQIDKMIKEADEDGDGQFSFDEFLALIKSDKFGCPK